MALAALLQLGWLALVALMADTPSHSTTLALQAGTVLGIGIVVVVAASTGVVVVETQQSLQLLLCQESILEQEGSRCLYFFGCGRNSRSRSRQGQRRKGT